MESSTSPAVQPTISSGSPVKVLFVCSRNRLRSPTAEVVFADYEGIETASAGLNNDSPTPVDAAIVKWADVIMVMEDAHLRRLKQKFASQLKGKEVTVLGIPDRYEFMDGALVQLLQERVSPRLKKANRPKRT
jgi:predicted protein tyrosine phosphatase